MISEAIAKLEEMTTQALSPVVIDTGDKNSLTVFVPQTNEFRHWDRPAFRKDSVRVLEHFAALLGKYAPSDDSVIYVSPDKAVLVLDNGEDEYKASRLTLNLTPSSVFSAFNRSHEPMDQKAFLRKLRTELATCEFNCELKAAIETIRWSAGDDGESKRTNGGDAMGRSVRAEVSGVKAPIPEEVLITFRPYPLEPQVLAVEIDCALIVDHEEKKFFLIPKPHEIDRAKLEAQKSIQQWMAGEADVTTVIGEP